MRAACREARAAGRNSAGTCLDCISAGVKPNKTDQLLQSVQLSQGIARDI